MIIFFILFSLLQYIKIHNCFEGDGCYVESTQDREVFMGLSALCANETSSVRVCAKRKKMRKIKKN
jgi:hypothetical protein